MLLNGKLGNWKVGSVGESKRTLKVKNEWGERV